MQFLGPRITVWSPPLSGAHRLVPHAPKGATNEIKHPDGNDGLGNDSQTREAYKRFHNAIMKDRVKWRLFDVGDGEYIKDSMPDM